MSVKITSRISRIINRKILSRVIVKTPKLEDIAIEYGQLIREAIPLKRVSEIIPRMQFFGGIESLIDFIEVKIIRAFNLIGLPATRSIIEDLAQDKRIEKIYPDRIMNIVQFPTLDPKGIYFDERKKKNFTSTAWTKKYMGGDIANSKGYRGEGVSVAVIDSVPSYSPCLIEYQNGEIDVLPLEDIWDLVSSPVFSNEKGEEWKSVQGIKIYTGRMKSNDNKPWQSIKRIIRHKYNGPLIRVRALEGIVDLSPNHSVFIKKGRNLRLIDAKDLSIGQQLSILKPEGIDRDLKVIPLFIGGLDLAWLYGFFAAEGSAYITKKGRYSVSFSNSNLDLLEKARKIFSHYFNVGKGSLSYEKESKTWKVEWRGKALYHHFRSKFYVKSGYKKIPKEILNAKKVVQTAFLEGYLDGDGTRWDNRSPKSITTNSWALATGLLLLINRCIKKPYAVHYRKDKPNIIQVGINKLPLEEIKERIISRNSITKIDTINYSGYLYDLETQNHVFTTGVGLIRVHNTGGTKLHRATYHIELHTVMKGQYSDANGHGEWCLACIGGKSFTDPYYNVPTEGFAPNCRLISIKALGYVLGMGSESGIIQAMELARKLGAEIISMSLGSEDVPYSPEEDPEIEVVKKLTEDGMIVVCAAGNSGPNPSTINSPGAAEQALTIGALNPFNNTICDFSSRGPVWGLTKPDVCAPGYYIDAPTIGLLDVLEDRKPQRSSWMSGTSMATPMCAGLITLMAQALKKNGLKLKTEMVKDMMSKYGQVTTKDNSYGWGVPTWEIFEKYCSEVLGIKV
jgi:subtilisin family serine protease